MDKAERSDSRQIVLPADVLARFVFVFLDAKDLKACAPVCKEWKEAADQDIVWKEQCVRLWQGKWNVPRILQEPTIEPACVYPFAIFPPTIKLSVKEMKQVLSVRMIPTERFIERSEFQRALEISQPTSIVGVKSSSFTSKWKCSYVHSLVHSTQARITKFELTQTLWKMEFKVHNMTCEARFNGDGTYTSTLGNLGHNGPLYWVFAPNSDGNMFSFSSVRIGEYPELHVKRALSNNSWKYELHNDYVVFRQAETRPFA